MSLQTSQGTCVSACVNWLTIAAAKCKAIQLSIERRAFERNRQGNLYFTGDTIYSYGSHSHIRYRNGSHIGGAFVRITKRKKKLLRLYRCERGRGFQASWALSNARTRLEWEKHEVAEYSSGEPIDPKRGNVRLRVVPDDTCSLEDLEGDCFNPKVNPDIPASRLQHDREEFIAKVNQEGVWGIIGEYFDGEVWRQADSCFGFLGDDWKYSGYDTDIMRATLDEAKAARVCRCCGRPIKTALRAEERIKS